MRLLHNARIHTFTDGNPIASVLVIDSGRILAAGGDELLDGFDKVQSENMQGGVILPGLVDAHIHLQEFALSLRIVDCEGKSKAEIISMIAGNVRDNPKAAWIRGHGWDQNFWGGAWPTAADLDPITLGIPAYLTAKSLHAAWANSLALKLAGINLSTPDPVNGKIIRDASGRPTGILLEDAVKLIESIIPETSPEEVAENFRHIIPDLHSMGITGIHDFDKSTCFQAFQILWEHADLHIRVVKSIPFELLSNAVDLGLRSGFGDDFLQIGSVKLFADGALGPHTGAMFEPYIDEPQNCGHLSIDHEQLFERGHLAVESGISLAVHAIGDRAIHEVLEGFSRLRAHERQHGLPPLRHRIEHVQTICPDDAGQLADLDITASMQPIHALTDMAVADRSLGERAAFTHAWRSLKDHGVRLAFGSDAPVENPNPFRGLYEAVTRCRTDDSPDSEGWFPKQRLTIREAIEGFTLGPAFLAGMENHLGRLGNGFLADLIVLNEDPFTCKPKELLNIQPRATMVGGEWVWKK